jgi:hypothetical protein
MYLTTIPTLYVSYEKIQNLYLSKKTNNPIIIQKQLTSNGSIILSIIVASFFLCPPFLYVFPHVTQLICAQTMKFVK